MVSALLEIQLAFQFVLKPAERFFVSFIIRTICIQNRICAYYSFPRTNLPKIVGFMPLYAWKKCVFFGTCQGGWGNMNKCLCSFILNINFLAYVSLSPLPPPAHCVHTLSQAQFLGHLTLLFA